MVSIFAPGEVLLECGSVGGRVVVEVKFLEVLGGGLGLDGEQATEGALEDGAFVLCEQGL